MIQPKIGFAFAILLPNPRIIPLELGKIHFRRGPTATVTKIIPTLISGISTRAGFAQNWDWYGHVAIMNLDPVRPNALTKQWAHNPIYLSTYNYAAHTPDMTHNPVTLY
jgi:hypothetical protein